MNKPPQFDLPVAGDAFNLAGESGVDIERVLREQRAQLARQIESRDYAARMQHTFEQCPGFIGGSTPSSEQGRGFVVVEPARIVEALAWLKRRFHASETMDVNTKLNGIAVEVAPRIRHCSNGGRRVKIRFGKVEQFTLPL